jgi:hypothetical protein
VAECGVGDAEGDTSVGTGEYLHNSKIAAGDRRRLFMHNACIRWMMFEAAEVKAHRWISLKPRIKG